MVRWVRWLNPDYVLQTIFYGPDLKTIGVVNDFPDVPANIRQTLSLNISSYSLNSGFKTVRRDVLERLCCQKPVSLYEIDRVRHSLSYYLGQATQRRCKDEAYKDAMASILNCLERHVNDMVVIRDSHLAHDRIISDQDPFLFQRRVMIISSVVAVFSAFASIAAAALSYFQLFRFHSGH